MLLTFLSTQLSLALGSKLLQPKHIPLGVQVTLDDHPGSDRTAAWLHSLSAHPTEPFTTDSPAAQTHQHCHIKGSWVLALPDFNAYVTSGSRHCSLRVET